MVMDIDCSSCSCIKGGILRKLLQYACSSCDDAVGMNLTLYIDVLTAVGK